MLDDEFHPHSSESPRWNRYVVTYKYAKFHREGWAGVWDALLAALHLTPRKTLVGPLSMSVWADAPVMISCPEMEIGSDEKHTYSTTRIIPIQG